MKPVSTQTMQEVGVDRLAHVEGQQSHDRVGTEILRDRQDPEDHLQPVQQEGDDEVGIGDSLRAIAHDRSRST